MKNKYSTTFSWHNEKYADNIGRRQTLRVNGVVQENKWFIEKTSREDDWVVAHMRGNRLRRLEIPGSAGKARKELLALYRKYNSSTSQDKK